MEILVSDKGKLPSANEKKKCLIIFNFQFILKA